MVVDAKHNGYLFHGTVQTQSSPDETYANSGGRKGAQLDLLNTGYVLEYMEMAEKWELGTKQGKEWQRPDKILSGIFREVMVQRPTVQS